MQQESEYDRLIGKKKPMVAYYKAVGEPYYYRDRDKFINGAKDGLLVWRKFFIKNEKQDFRMSYEVFALPTESWRLDLYAYVKRVGQRLWTPDLEAIESIVLGYREVLVGACGKGQGSEDLDHIDG